MSSETSSAPTTTTTTNGRVKWFNNKAGYGFITVNDCETNEERDIFVHHSEIQVQQSQYISWTHSEKKNDKKLSCPKIILCTGSSIHWKNFITSREFAKSLPVNGANSELVPSRYENVTSQNVY